MKSFPRILPLVGIAVGGVLAINALAGARDLPGLLSGAKAFAEEAAKPAAKKGGARKAGAPKAAATDTRAADGQGQGQGGLGSLFADPNHPDSAANVVAATPAAGAPAAGGAAKDAASTSPLPPPTIQPKAVCAPTAAELAKEAGLSPAELQVLQNLGARRGELDQREQALSVQVALLAAAEAKLDAKAKVLQGLKADIQNLLAQADGKEQQEVDRLVKVFEGMKPKDAALRMAALDDGVRLPIAAKMKERALSAIVGQMPVADAKKLTEGLAKRFTSAQILAQNADAKADAAAAATKVADADPAKAAPTKKPARAARKAPAKKKPAAEGDDTQTTAAADKPTAAPAKAG